MTMRFLKSYAMIYMNNPKLHIMQLDVHKDISKDIMTYCVVIKTYWLRLVQRHWKKTYKSLQEILRNRRSYASLRYFEINGKYRVGDRVLPRLEGMLNVYTRNKKKQYNDY